jgi:hypothetical protein
LSLADKQVFPSLELIGWYSVSPHPTALHIALHEQVSVHTYSFCSIYINGRCSLLGIARLHFFCSCNHQARQLPPRTSTLRHCPSRPMNQQSKSGIANHVPYSSRFRSMLKLEKPSGSRLTGRLEAAEAGQLVRLFTSRRVRDRVLKCVTSGIAPTSATSSSEDVVRAPPDRRSICHRRHRR